MQETKTIKKPIKLKLIMREIYDWADSILFALIMVIVILVFVVRGTRVEGPSMLPTLENAQFLAITHLYTSLEHNDIVVVYSKNIDGADAPGRNIIKRVIGLPGDTIALDTAAGRVYRNSEALPIEYIDGSVYENGHLISEETRSRSDMPEGAVWIVPENHIFVMGDNRNYSKDSRSSEVGMIDMNYIIGRVLFRVTPFEKFGPVS
jgi:signal peptidase I